MSDEPVFYMQFDGDEVAGKRYDLGEKLAADVDAGTRDYLLGTGRISIVPPADSGVAIVDTDKAPADMTRAELEASALAAVRDQMKDATDDDLRHAIERHRADGGAGEGGGEKPLNEMSGAELDEVAEREGVTYPANTNKADRVKAIQAKRDAA